MSHFLRARILGQQVRDSYFSYQAYAQASPEKMLGAKVWAIEDSSHAFSKRREVHTLCIEKDRKLTWGEARCGTPLSITI